MTDKEKYLDFHGYVPGTPEAEAAWAEKEAMNRGVRRAAPMVFVSADVCYDSPIDGRPITNKHARIEDMKRAGCIEYDPGMKQDYQRRIVESEKRLDKQVDETFDRTLSELPARKREALFSELRSGVDVTPERQTLG
jgi:hypothetical protein